MPALVVLGARNLGGAILDRFLADGWQATGIARSAETVATIDARGARGIQADVTDPARLRDALLAAGPVDCLVNAVSVARFDPEVPWGGGPLADATLDRYRTWGAAVAEQAFVFFSEGARLLIDQRRPATLIQIANRSSRQAAQGMGAWAAGWHGVRALTLAAADELRGHGIHVALVIVDGPIESPKTAHMIAGMEPDEVNDQADIAATILGVTRQGRRGRSHELTLTPAGRPPAPWS
jgi:NAD(P)-dependent dehydrogenase (short-subunit alcohol dehydrogenase family)